MIDRDAYILEIYPEISYSAGDTAATLKEKIAEAVKTKRSFCIFEGDEFYEVVIENGSAKVADKGKTGEKRKWINAIIERNGVFFEGVSVQEQEEYVIRSFIVLKDAIFFETDQGILVRSLTENGAFMRMDLDPLMKGSVKK